MSIVKQYRRPLVFISYSRQDFNYAEAVTATLNRSNNVDAWMDIQYLRPGMDWNKVIDEGLRAADALLLIGSRSAFNSSYVRSEWQQALKRGIPVHIVFVEPIDIPTELQFCPVHDVRSQFWRQVDAIGRLIATKSQESTASWPLPQPNLWRLPGKIPWKLTSLLILLVSIAGILMYLGSVMGGLYIALSERWFGALVTSLDEVKSIVLLPTISILGFALVVLNIATGLLYRRSSLSALASVLSLAIVSAIASKLFMTFLLIDVASLVGYTTVLRETMPLFSVAAISILVASSLAGVLLIRSRTIRLWLPTGQNYDSLRQRILDLPMTLRQRIRFFRPDFSYQWKGFANQLKSIVSERVVTFEIRYDPADQPIAEVIHKACQTAGLSMVAKKPQWVLTIVSSKTNWKKVHRNYKAFGSRGIFILVDNVRLPPDISELRRYQWLDFREQRPESLFSLLASLVTVLPAKQNMAPVPINPQQFRAPRFMRGFVGSCRTYVVVVVMVTLALLTQRALGMSTILFCEISILLTIGFIRLMTATATRSISRARFRMFGAILFLLMTVWAAMLIFDYLKTNVIWWWPIPIVTVLIVTLWHAYVHARRYWLPRTTKPTSKQSTVVRPPFLTIQVFIQAVTFFAIFVALFAY